jgi:uncharacterized short protein YbdD (DUF466 family)
MSRITLKDISTRELLRARRDARYGSEYGGDRLKQAGDFTKRETIAFRLVKGGESQSAVATMDELLAELATRPHIPSRSEGKLLRRLMAQTGQSADWLRAHPKYGEMLADHQHPNRRRITKEQAARFAKPHFKGFGNVFKVEA